MEEDPNNSLPVDNLQVVHEYIERGKIHPYRALHITPPSMRRKCVLKHKH